MGQYKKMRILLLFITGFRTTFLDKLSAKTKADTFENCEVTCAIWEEIFEDIDDALKQLKDTDDDIKADLTSLSITNVEQNKRLTTVEELAEDNKDALNITTLEIATLKDKNDLLTLQNSIFENSIKTIEARLDILEENSGASDEIDEIRTSIAELSDQMDAYAIQLEELSTNMTSQNDKINETIGSLEEFDLTVTGNLTDLADEISDLRNKTESDVDMLQQNLTDLKSEFDEKQLQIQD